MYKIVRKRALNDSVTLMEVQAPHIAKKAKAGQFIIFRVDEQGERVPLTITDYDREAGTVTIIYQIVGASTKLLNTLEEGDSQSARDCRGYRRPRHDRKWRWKKQTDRTQ